MTTKMFIDGGWTASGGRPTFATYDPATGKVLEQVPEATTEDVDAAVPAADRAFGSPEWAGMLPARRAKLLLDVADLIEAHAKELARLETINQGQPLAVSAGFAVPNAVEHFRYYAGWATKITGVTVPVSVPGVDYRTRREPLGGLRADHAVELPADDLAWKLAPALATGNTVVIKPADGPR